jgi:8-amino-7-oxononanoate synthase
MSSATQLSVESIPSLRQRSGRRWIDHWLDTLQDIGALRASHPMMDAVIDEIDGRMIRVGDQWLADFASCNYLGFDLDPEIIQAVPAFLEAWASELVAAARKPCPL